MTRSVNRWIIARSLALLGCLLLPAAARADYPDHTVRMIVGQSPGGGTDEMARMVAQGLAEMWKQPVVVENRPGSAGIIAESLVVHSAPDGYTIMLVNSDHTIVPSQYKLNYDPIKGFTPITQLASEDYAILVNPAVLPVKSLDELVARAKSDSGKMNFGTGGARPYVEYILLTKRLGINIQQVNYTGTGPTMVALLGGETQITVGSVVGTLGYVQSGKLRALAVTSSKRLKMIPDVPTVAEATKLPGRDIGSWYGVVAPANLPQPLVDKLHHDIIAVLNSPDVHDRMDKHGYGMIGSSPQAFGDVIKDEIQSFAPLFTQTDAKP